MAKSAPKLEGVDLFGFEAMLSDDERAVKTQMRAFVEKEILPTIGKHFAAGTFPKHLIPQLGELGLPGSQPHRLRLRRGSSSVAYGLAMQELERGDAGIRSFVLGAGLAGDVPHLAVRLGGAEAEVPAQDGHRAS